MSTALDNAGALTADENGGLIDLRDAAKANSNVMQASGGGYLDLRAPINQTSSGRIRADGGTVRLWNGTNILSGRLETTGASEIRLSGGNQTCILRDVTNLGTLTIVDGGTCAFQNTALTNNGVIRVLYGGTYGNAALRFDSPNVQVFGSGAIEFGGRVDQRRGVRPGRRAHDSWLYWHDQRCSRESWSRRRGREQRRHRAEY